jgi:hypothetical protein
MTRKLLILALTILMIIPQVVFASGGANPPIPTGTKVVGPRLHATIVMDPHNPTDTTNGWATVRIQRKQQYSAIVFQMPNPSFNFPLGKGCRLVDDNGSDLTENRFLGAPLYWWMPADAVATLLSGVGIVFDPDDPNVINSQLGPRITSVDNAVCTPDDPLTGTLSFDAVIEFVELCTGKKCPTN